MSDDLISRSALLEKNQPVDFLFGHEEDAPYSGMAVDACDIEDAPAVDAAKVVRCKDCIRWYEREPVCLKIYSDSGCHYSAWQERKPNDFCSYGERKYDGDNEPK